LLDGALGGLRRAMLENDPSFLAKASSKFTTTAPGDEVRPHSRSFAYIRRDSP